MDTQDHNTFGNFEGNNFQAPKPYGNPVIKVIGVGGGGSNAVARMFKEKAVGVEYFAVNTDAQHLTRSEVPNKMAIGQNISRGLGVGGNPDIGRQAAEESREELEKMVQGSDMVFLAAGMGGGTGTGAAPVIAQIAKEAGALTIAVVSKPFGFEVATRRKNAEDGLARLQENVDTVITIPNDRLLQMDFANDQTKTWDDALRLADSVLQQGIQAVAEVVTIPGEINVDFADVRTVMSEMGKAMMGSGAASGPDRAEEAAEAAIASPLLEDIDLSGARGILVNITAGPDFAIDEFETVGNAVKAFAS